MWLLLAAPGALSGLANVKALQRVLIATVAMGCANFFYKVGLRAGALPETLVAAQAWAFCSSATVIGWLRERRFRFTPGGWRYSALAALALGFGFVLLLHGLAVGPASVLVPVAQMGFVFTALAGIAMFGESFDSRKARRAGGGRHRARIVCGELSARRSSSASKSRTLRNWRRRSARRRFRRATRSA
ncbi:MAG: EamA family transporter [Pseudolabrys sp.]